MSAAARTAGLVVLVAATSVAWTGCASSAGPFREHYEAGRYEAAAEAFEADSALHDDAGALFRAGLIYGTPGTPVYDPSKALARLRRQLELEPEGERAREARSLLRMLTRADSLARQLERLKAVDLERPAADTARRF